MDRAERIGCGVLGCVGVLVVAIVVVVVRLVAVAARHADVDVPEDPRDRPLPRTAQAWLPCKGRPAPADSVEVALTVADPRRVDVADVFAGAKALVLRLEPSAELTSISSTALAAEGMFDLTAANMSLNFEYRCLDTTKPAGLDRRQGHAFVLLQHRNMVARRVEISAGLADLHAPMTEPPCGTVAAWRSVTASGVPNDARATFVLAPSSGPLEGGWVWLVDVPGHPDYRRQVDARTCGRVSKDGRIVR